MLLDHFQPPLKRSRHWHSFHNAWAANLAAALNRHLPEDYFAEPNVMFGIEIDVATMEEAPTTSSATTPGGAAVVSTLAWQAPAPAHSLPFTPATDTIEVNIFGSSGGPTLVGAIELISPANKDRAEHRQAFVSKCESYLNLGVGLVIVDVVTERAGNLHDELLARVLGNSAPSYASQLYATAYRVVQRDEQSGLDIWQEALGVGVTLPTMPLWLRGGLCLPVELAATYERTCQDLKISAEVTASA